MGSERQPARRQRKKPLHPYRRLESTLKDTRHALVMAAEAYTETLQALGDLLVYWEEKDSRSGWTAGDIAALERIRKIASGPFK